MGCWPHPAPTSGRDGGGLPSPGTRAPDQGPLIDIGSGRGATMKRAKSRGPEGETEGAQDSGCGRRCRPCSAPAPGGLSPGLGHCPATPPCLRELRELGRTAPSCRAKSAPTLQQVEGLFPRAGPLPRGTARCRKPGVGRLPGAPGTARGRGRGLPTPPAACREPTGGPSGKAGTPLAVGQAQGCLIFTAPPRES